MNWKPIKYSVVFTTYNRPELTESVIYNAILGAGIDFELIWVDDCSTEYKVIEIMSKLSEELSIDIKSVLRKENGGWAQAVNDGLKEATGDYIFILDNDWALPENWLQIFDYYIKNIPNTGGACMMWKGFESYGWMGGKEFKNNIEVNHCNKICGFRCFSREVFNKVGYLDDRLGWYGPQDSDWSNRALRTGELFYYIPNQIVYHLEDGFNKDKKKQFVKDNADKLKNKKDNNIYYSPYEPRKT